MKLSGSYTFAAPREDVWALLNDPATLQRIIPGCERLEQIGGDLYSADVKLGLPGVRGAYSGTVKLVELQPPERYRLEGDGRGKPGFARGAGDVELIAAPDGTTILRYSGEAQVGGPVAGIGQRLIEGAAKSIINQSLKALSAELEARREASAPAGEQQDETIGDQTRQPHGAADVTPPGESAASEAALAAPRAATAAQPSPSQPEAATAPGLTAMDVMRGIADDLLNERPWMRWSLPLAGGFALGILVGMRIGGR